VRPAGGVPQPAKTQFILISQLSIIGNCETNRFSESAKNARRYGVVTAIFRK